MAEVTIEIDEDYESEILTEEQKNAIKHFIEKHKEINKLFNDRMVVVENGLCSFFPDFWGETFSTRDINENESIARGVFKYYSSDIGSDTQFSFGQEPFDEEFYEDLFNLQCSVCEIDSNLNQDIDSPEITGVIVVGYPGYYTSMIKLTPKGLKWDVTYYEEEDWQ